jgi:hypothetical protein
MCTNQLFADLFLNACLVRQNLIKPGFMLPLFVLDAMVCIVLIAMYGGVTTKNVTGSPRQWVNGGCRSIQRRRIVRFWCK